MSHFPLNCLVLGSWPNVLRFPRHKEPKRQKGADGRDRQRSSHIPLPKAKLKFQPKLSDMENNELLSPRLTFDHLAFWY